MVEMLPTAVLLVLAVSVVARVNSTCDGSCGLPFRQTLQATTRVVGGQAAAHGAWPWMVSLQVFTYHNSRMYHACGGTLLNAQWVLTAAHCFRLNKKPYDWRLIFGARELEYGRTEPVKAPLQERFVEKIIPHERYSSISEANDIALMKVTPPVVCGSLVGPGCLPLFKAGPPRASQSCWVTGWGFLRENDRKMSPVLQEARVDILDLNLCNSTRWYRGRVRSTNVCAGYPEGNIDTCQGDSGGPLMCRGPEDAYVVVGITSWGVGCARTKRPGIYTSTWPYLSWIASKIGIQALQMAQPAQQGTPAPTSTATNPTQLPSAHPPWYFQHLPQPLPIRPPASRPRPPAPPSPRPPAQPPYRPPAPAPSQFPALSLYRPPAQPPYRPPAPAPSQSPALSLYRPPAQPPYRPPAPAPSQFPALSLYRPPAQPPYRPPAPAPSQSPALSLYRPSAPAPPKPPALPLLRPPVPAPPKPPALPLLRPPAPAPPKPPALPLLRPPVPASLRPPALPPPRPPALSPPPPPPTPPQPPPPFTKPTEAPSFAKRLQQLIETLKGNTRSFRGRGDEEMEAEKKDE